MDSWIQVNHGLEQALAIARESAERRGVATFGPEFLLEALLARSQGLPVRILGRIGVRLDALRAELQERLSRSPAAPPVESGPDEAAQEAIARAGDIAVELGHPVVGQTHLLLALLQDAQAIPGDLLHRHGASFEAVKEALLSQMAADAAGAGPDAAEPMPSRHEASFSPLLRSILKDAPQMARLCRQAQCAPEHLLAALLHRGQGEAIAILRETGVDLVELSIALEGRFDFGEEIASGLAIEHSPLADKVLVHSRRLAYSLGATEADTEHLLLALLQVESLASALLADFRLTDAGIRRRLDKAHAASKPLVDPESIMTPINRDSADNKEARMTDDANPSPAPPVGMVIHVARTPEAAGLPLPAYETAHAAAMDLRAAIPEDAPLTLEPGRWGLVPTGLMVAIPPGFEGQVRARSGLAAKHGIGVLNGPGTIDADYRGEIKVILFNFSVEPFVIRRGDRVAQLAIARVERVAWEPTDRLPETDRGEGGFGHTGR
jgi:dUTP pyrophosphatase